MTLEGQIQQSIKDMGKVMGVANKALAGLSDEDGKPVITKDFYKK